MCKRLLALLCSLMLLPCFALAESAMELSEEEINELLWEMYQTENGDADFMVLPDDYEEPAVGKKGVFNLLLVGVDTDNDSLKGRSDTMLLASFNARTGEVRLVSFLRDTYVSIPGKGHNKLNASYSYGGAELLIETLEKNFKVEIDGYLAVNYSLMVEMVDAIGGIEINVTKEEVPKLNGILEYYNYQRGVPADEGKLQSEGLQLLNGLQAMSYARIRKLDSDFVRVERQQKVILAVYHKVLSCDIVKLTGLVFEYIGRVGTNISLAKATELLITVFKIKTIDTSTLRIPCDGAYNSKTINGTYYIVPKLTRCQEELHAFLYDYAQD